MMIKYKTQNYLLYLLTITGPCTDRFIGVYKNLYAFDEKKLKFKIVIVYAHGKLDDTEKMLIELLRL